MTARRGSVLMMALWIIAILSVMVVSFAFEARQQAGIDIYVRERNRVRRIIDSGRMLGEIVLLGYKDAPDPEIKSGAPDWKDAFEDDRWVIEKYNLKTNQKCTIGPICLEEADPDEADATDPVTVTVELVLSPAIPGIDINSLCEDVDSNYADMLRIILRQSGIDDELEVEMEDASRSGRKRHNLMNLLIASWKDWRDEDDVVSKGPLPDDSNCRHEPQDDDGAEKSWYEERDEEDEIPVKDRRVPANGRIKKLEELSYIRGFRDFPAVLIGGRLYDNAEGNDGRGKRGGDDKDDEANPKLSGIMDYFKLFGGPKIVLDDATRRKDLMVHLLLFVDDLDDQNDCGDMDDLADAILLALKTMPEDDDDIDETRTWWPFKNFDDLCTRVEDVGCDVNVPPEFNERIKWPGESSGGGAAERKSNDKNSQGSGDVDTFSMTITGESMGMKYVVTARCIVEDKKVRYIEWSENDVEAKGARK